MTKTQVVLTAIITLILTIALNTFIIQACWNYFMPAVFVTVPKITFFQSMVLAVLVNTLTGKTGAAITKKEG